MEVGSAERGEVVKAISIWQPHASLIICGSKPFETRSWPAHRNLIGKRIAIHAGKCLDDLEELSEYIAETRDEPELAEIPSFEAMWKALFNAGFKTLNELPRGCVIGTAVLSESIRTDDLAEPGHFGNFEPGRFAWRMTDVEMLPVPVQFRGQQGFFDVPDNLLKTTS